MSSKPLQKTVKEQLAPPARVSLRARLFQSYILIAFFLFAVLAVTAKLVPYYSWDLPVLRYIQSIPYPLVTSLLAWISWPGYYPQALIFTLIIFTSLWFLGLRWESVSHLLGFSSAGMLAEIFKLVIDRLRPASGLVKVAQVFKSPSFPSGHVVTYTVGLGFLVFLSYSLIKKRFLRGFCILLFALPVLLVGPSRVYLGAHWPSDTLGAYLLGSGWLFLTIYFYRWGKPRYFVRQPVLPKIPQTP